MLHRSILLQIVFSVCAILFISQSLSAATDLSHDQLLVQTKVQKVLETIDSTAFSNQVPTDEFIVNAYWLAKQRQPDAFEFYYCKSFNYQKQIGPQPIISSAHRGR